MKPFAFIALLLCAWPAAAQPPPREAQPCPTDTRYDRAKDLTLVFCGPFNPDPTTPKHTFDVTLIVEYKGASLKAPANYFITLVWFDEAEGSKPLHKGARTLYLQTDTTLLKLPIERDTEPDDSMDGLAIEVANVKVEAATLRALLAADRVTGRWAGTEFKFSDSGLRSYKDFMRPLLADNPSGAPPAPAIRRAKPKPRPERDRR